MNMQQPVCPHPTRICGLETTPQTHEQGVLPESIKAEPLSLVTGLHCFRTFLEERLLVCYYPESN